ncbi:MAG TPA: hypothetical protein VEO01_16360 [Pseudonocardiaceae bacterium]|nr:hypothetical protein [Pseudonocardiaceae bacterium]
MSARTQPILDTVIDLIRTSSDRVLPDEIITMDTMVRADLELDSIDLVGLAGRLQARYGDVVNLSAFLASVDADGATDMRVGHFVEFIARALDRPATEPA